MTRAPLPGLAPSTSTKTSLSAAPAVSLVLYAAVRNVPGFATEGTTASKSGWVVGFFDCSQFHVVVFFCLVTAKLYRHFDSFGN